MSDIAQYLAAMFEADRDVPDDEWFERFPPYKFDRQPGAEVSWYALSDIWRCQGEPQDWENSDQRKRTAAAWALLQRLYAEYTEAKQAKRG